MKYICSKWRPELLGSDPATLASVEMLWAYVAKLKEEATAPCYQGKSNQEIMDVCFPLIEQLVTFMGDKQWITGSNLTWLDFMFFELVNLLDFLSGGVVKTHYETLGAYCSRFESLPNFSEAWKDDTLTIKWPWNGDMATIGGRGIAE
jgi:glutathione S-transferase